MEGLEGEAHMAPAADWEPEEIADIVPVEEGTPPSDELTLFAGHAMTTEAAVRMASAASHEGMGI